MNYEQLSKAIIKDVGGKDNVISVVHCTTRLRFKLKDESKANDADLKNMDGVVTVVKSAGQYQVVIGNQVADVYDELIKVGGFQANGTVSDDYVDKENMKLTDRFIDVISSIFTPFLGTMAAAGMIKGGTAALASMGLMSQASGTYKILYAIGDSFFYFLPIALAITAAKKFKVHTFIAFSIAASLVYPTMIAAASSKTVLATLFKGTILASPVHLEFFGLPVITMNYSSTVIPILIAVWFASYVQRWVKKALPTVVQTFLVPFFTLLIVVPLTFLVIGPVATWAGDLLSALVNSVYGLSPILAALVVGALWQVLVIFGIHWSIVAIALVSITTVGYDHILPLSWAASFAQTGVVLAVMMQTKDTKKRSIALPAFISGIFGVTEPAIYGVTLPMKKPFYISCVASALSAILIALGKVKMYMMAGMGVFVIPAVINPKTGIDSSLYYFLAAIVLAFILGWLLQIMFGKKAVMASDQAAVAANVQNVANEATTLKQNAALVKHDKDLNDATKLVSPLAGKVLPLSSVKDEVFAGGAMGKGCAIEPTVGELRAPAAGHVALVFPTGHAIGLHTDDGAEVLMHIGMDTVNLHGKYFETVVKQGDEVKPGQLLVKFNLEKIKQAGYTVTTPVVITNSKNYTDVTSTTAAEVKPGDELLDLN